MNKLFQNTSRYFRMIIVLFNKSVRDYLNQNYLNRRPSDEEHFQTGHAAQQNLAPNDIFPVGSFKISKLQGTIKLY